MREVEVHHTARLVIERVERSTASVVRSDSSTPKRGVTEVVNLALKAPTLKALAAKLLKHITIITEEEDE